ncbi:2-oxo acid dehydrogenase subunit E2 [Pseudomonas sp. BF-R-19]|uniref:2-oxo acid dehydrogenase subunit E2 n=1 Tax=Pseudomonas sp. BF-R-19 TaxID=2832397 RepID=UPI001CBC80EE|nr:2-oxo acid dehydrogenase subunit E2 [Pseudomonas sp. BF-R-19]
MSSLADTKKGSGGEALEVAPWPQIDFSSFGDVESVPLTRIQKLGGSFLSRNWVMVPHVTHHDDADVTAMEITRKYMNQAHPNVKVTPLVFLIKAVVAALKAFPKFNASLDGDGTHLVLKKYFHVGIAVDTPNGLLVAVLRDCDTKTWQQLAEEVVAVSTKAREKGLSMSEMSGGCFTISSLGAIGGTGFTPIVNAPEVAILGVTKTQLKPSPQGEGIEWRQVLPLSLSYDHRVINGADAARFTAFLGSVLASPEQLLEL